LVLRPAIYWPYTVAVSLRRALQKRRRQAFERRRQARAQAETNEPAGSVNGKPEQVP
jgi:hypothetical protein